MDILRFDLLQPEAWCFFCIFCKVFLLFCYCFLGRNLRRSMVSVAFFVPKGFAAARVF